MLPLLRGLEDPTTLSGDYAGTIALAIKLEGPVFQG
jgi:hypothetical protein